MSIEANKIQLPNVSDIIMNLVDRPDPWSFLPESFAIENRIYTGPITMDCSSSYVSISNIPSLGIGKQMNVLYDIMLDIENTLSVVEPIYHISAQIAQLYQTFINENPDNYSLFETTISGISIRIELTDGYHLTIGLAGMSLELYHLTTESGFRYGGKLYITEANVIKYEVTNDSFVIAARLFGTFRAHIDFQRNQDGVRGTLYHFVGVNEIGINTRALLHVGQTYTTIIGETGDFLLQATTKRNVEVYHNQTGLLVGGEVQETVPIVGTYDTMWYPLNKISGITNIKVVNQTNGNNPNSIYINNKTSTFVTHNTLTGARQYDIELKTHYFYTYNSNIDQYSKIQIEVPMFFIWRNYEQGTGFTQVNSRNSITASNTVTLADKNAIFYGYDVLLPIYNSIRENMTPQNVIDYIANN